MSAPWRVTGAALVLAALAGCAPVPTPRSAPLIYNTATWPVADRAVIAIPGALTSIRVMRPAIGLAAPEGAAAFYRLPGFDGRPESDFVKLDFAARHIATEVIKAGFARVDLVGHSAGAAIALEAAKEIRRRSPGTQVRIAAISAALPAPQPTLAGMRGALGTVGAALRNPAESPRAIWLDYYETLAYGPAARTEPQVARKAEALAAENAQRITLPRRGLARRHTRDLQRWTHPGAAALEGVDITFYHGSDDPLFPARAAARFARSLPQAKLRVIEGHGHLLMLTYPEIWTLIDAQFAGAGPD